jgi:hypothetical protein
METIAHLPARMGLMIQPIPEPERWHEGPYCHIYITACENIDHYRTKIHPTIRAFVDQIEGSGIGIKDDSTHGSLHLLQWYLQRKRWGSPRQMKRLWRGAVLAASKTSFVLIIILLTNNLIQITL